MRWILWIALFHPSVLLMGQAPVPANLTPPSSEDTGLPDAPSHSAQVAATYRQSVTVITPGLPPCESNKDAASTIVTTTGGQPPCVPPENRNPYQRFLNSPTPLVLTPRQKGLLAIRDVVDPGNLFTITANAGFTTGIDSHTAYGPGWRGFGRDIGYSLVQDATGEFISTFALDSLLSEDPHYHRSPKATVPRRFLHAISHTVRSQHDDGRPMPNYSTLLTYPISAELSNLYVPGVHGNAPSTVKRVAIGLASNPIDDIITEFLPDFARRVHIRVVFVQQILNNVSSGAPL